MHGRLKVRSTEEQELQKKLRQEAKLKEYLPCLEKIHCQREQGELNTSLIARTGAILGSNPDFYTLWNIRKQCLLYALENNPETVDQLFARDLEFTEQCLKVNPKSYGAWHHRCWVMDNGPTKDFQQELQLCTRYLKLDERNFHCWDYRRFVVERMGAEVRPEDELKFCLEKIEQNFSNYSSWHYRSKLLPKVHPDPNGILPIDEATLQSELQLVMTATFTDPKDSSAWFYQRWLMGAQSHDTQAIIATYCSQDCGIMSFSKPLEFRKSCRFIDLPVGFEWMGNVERWQSSNNKAMDHTWFIKETHIVTDREPFQITIKIDVLGEGARILKHDVSFVRNATATECYWYGLTPLRSCTFSAAVMETLRGQLSQCEELLELEPDSKWTLLTTALLMHAVDRQSYHSQTLAMLERLQTVDELRVGYYADLASQWMMEERLRSWVADGCIDKVLDLTGLPLTCLHLEQYLAIAKLISLDDMVAARPRISRILKRLPNLRASIKADKFT